MISKHLTYSLKKTILCCCLFVYAYSGIAQVLPLTIKNEHNSLTIAEYKFESLEDSKDFMLQYVSQKQFEGYLTFNLDSLFIKNDTIIALVYKGKKEIIKIELDPTTSLNPNKHNTKISADHNYIDLLKIIEEQGNIGFPFSRFIAKSTSIKDSIIHVNYVFNEGPFITIDSIIIRSKTDINSRVFSKYLKIEKGEPYNEAKVKSISKNLNELTYFRSAGETNVVFKEKGSDIYMYVEKNPANIFNGIIGIQPNSESEKISFTGDISLQLANNFNRAESLKFNWKKIEQNTQELDLKVDFPYLFYSDIGITGTLNLYKQDTSFVSLDTKFGLNYFFTPLNSIEVFFERETDNELIDSEQYSDLTVSYYGLLLKWQEIDRRFNPTKGYFLESTFSIGQKNSEDDNLTEDGSELKNEQIKFKNNFQYFIPIRKRQVILLENKINLLESDVIYDNELARLGGNKSIRGFDLNSIFATSSIIQTIEYRYLLDKNTNVKLFFDQMWYERNRVVDTDYSRDTPFSFGAGFSFLVGSGIFSFEYALGSQRDNPILIKDGKIHFGFINLF